MYPIKLQKTGMLTIQKVTVADCELINKMAGEVFPATYKEILSPEQLDYMMDWMYAPENIRKQMEEEGHVYFIAYKEGKPCGYVSVQQQEKDIFHLQKIYVLPHFQGSHCGSFLFKEAIKYIKEIHPEPCLMELNVNRNNKALHTQKYRGSRCQPRDSPSKHALPAKKRQNNGPYQIFQSKKEASYPHLISFFFILVLV